MVNEAQLQTIALHGGPCLEPLLWFTWCEEHWLLFLLLLLQGSLLLTVVLVDLFLS